MRDQVIIPVGSLSEQVNWLRQYDPTLTSALMATQPRQYTLTRAQRDLLGFINAYLADHGIAPSYEEAMEALDLKSKSGVHRMMVALEQRGVIRRLPAHARAIEIVGQV